MTSSAETRGRVDGGQVPMNGLEEPSGRIEDKEVKQECHEETGPVPGVRDR